MYVDVIHVYFFSLCKPTYQLLAVWCFAGFFTVTPDHGGGVTSPCRRPKPSEGVATPRCGGRAASSAT